MVYKNTISYIISKLINKRKYMILIEVFSNADFSDDKFDKYGQGSN